MLGVGLTVQFALVVGFAGLLAALLALAQSVRDFMDTVATQLLSCGTEKKVSPAMYFCWELCIVILIS